MIQTERKPKKNSMRLNKFIAQSGICSRRHADELIETGKVKVNDTIITELGSLINPFRDQVIVEGKRIGSIKQKLQYIIMNKPMGYICSCDDEKKRTTVLDLLSKELKSQRLFPVGRLDMQSEGLLILTNDGDFTYKMTHPKHYLSKTYLVKLQGIIEPTQFQKLSDESFMNSLGYKTVEWYIRRKTKSNTWLEITLFEGKNRQIRRIFEALNIFTLRIIRISLGPVVLGDLKHGEYRTLTKQELYLLEQYSKNII